MTQTTPPKELSLRNGLFWFSNDLRLEDNPALWSASEQVSCLLCVYIVDPAWFRGNRYNLVSLGNRRWTFLRQSLSDLGDSLATFNQRLHIVYANPLNAVSSLITRYNIDAIFTSQQAGLYEKQYWQTLQQRYPQLHFEQHRTHTLFQQTELPFELDAIPESFTKFRKLVEPLQADTQRWPLKTLPPIATLRQPETSDAFTIPPIATPPVKSRFQGGASAGQLQVREYFDSGLPSGYKEVRNALDGWQHSTKFSPWLANGCVSVSYVLRELQTYEQRHGANESTYWISFELLWREYFQWLAHASGNQLFRKSGRKNRRHLNSFYPERFQRWCQGNTPYPLVNACMKQLNATGFMSNRGRQIVASCFINELQLDWRYGAAYFEQQLIDYDVAVNWGNWQYLAGVGVDPRGKRHFDLAKQQAIYDPDGTFIAKWQGASESGTLDSVDAADWPIFD